MNDAFDILFNWPDSFDHGPAADDAFLKAMQTAFTHHYRDSEIYRNICEHAGFSISDLESIVDLPRIPWLLVDVFKWYHLTSVPEDQIVITFTSSGTTGQKSHTAWDQGSFDRQTAMRRRIMESYRLVDPHPVNYICFSYDQQTASHRGAAYAHSAYTTFAPAHEIFFAIHPGPGGEPAFDADECLDVLRRFEHQSYPLRITGFPAFAWRTLKAIETDGRPLHFAPESLVIHGGGWKTMADEAVTPDVYATAVEKWLGIPPSRVRDIYGFVEHGVPYVTCERGSFHVPVFSRIFVRKPGTLDLLPEGETGLLHAVAPYNWAQPALSIVSTDYVQLQSGCPCCRKGQTMKLLGRAGVRKHQGCALTAAELLDRTKTVQKAGATVGAK